MSEPDVAALLNATIDEAPVTSKYDEDDYAVVLPLSAARRARDEIVALRAQLRTRAVMDGSLAQVPGLLARSRTEALEKAAQTIERQPWPPLGPSRDVLAATIRALKDKADG